MAGVLDEVVSVDLVTKEWDSLSQEFDHLEVSFSRIDSLSHELMIIPFRKLTRITPQP